MKLTTKLLKEMIQQEMKEFEGLQYGGDDFDMPQAQSMKYIVVGPDGKEKEVSEHSFEMYVDQGYTQQESEDGTMRVFLGDEGARRRMKDFEAEMNADLDELTPEERKFAGL